MLYELYFNIKFEYFFYKDLEFNIVKFNIVYSINNNIVKI